MDYIQFLKERRQKQESARYQIVNPTTNRILTSAYTLSGIQHFWNHIPRRKTSELHLIDNHTGEILKIKPKKTIQS